MQKKVITFRIALPFTKEERLNRSTDACMGSKASRLKGRDSSIVLQYLPEAGVPRSVYSLFSIFVLHVNISETCYSLKDKHYTVVLISSFGSPKRAVFYCYKWNVCIPRNSYGETSFTT